MGSQFRLTTGQVEKDEENEGPERGSAGDVHRQGSPSPPPTQSMHADLELSWDQEKSLYPCSQCGKSFRDLRSHMLTHQTDRPHKCPISTCQFHLRGFARKYDQVRHTICHFRGFIVCEFCPGANSPDEISFHRIDILKKHLIQVHHVKPTKKYKKVPPPPAVTYSPDGVRVIGDEGDDMIIRSTSSANRNARCSICANLFHQPQHWYDHLEDCIMSTILQDVPSNQVNTFHLLSVANDSKVEETLHLHHIKVNQGLQRLIPTICDEARQRSQLRQEMKDNIEQHGAVHQQVEEGGFEQEESEQKKVRGASIPKGGRRRRGSRTDEYYPQDWGVSPEYLNLKRRALYVHDGPHRIWKDDLSLYTSLEVRLPLGNHAAHDYVTDLDIQTIHTAESIYHTHRSRTTTVPWDFMTSSS